MKLQVFMLALLLLVPCAVSAQKPDNVFFEHLTFDEIRDSIKAGARTVIVPIGGTGDNGPQLVLGTHNLVATYTADKIARELGSTLVAPVIAYSPAGTWQSTASEALKPGTISLPDDQGYTDLLEAAANSMKGSGFKNVVFIGESAGSQSGLKTVAERLNAAWKGTGVRVLYISDYFTKSQTDQAKYVTEKLSIKPADVGNHANIIETSELMAINGSSIRLDRLAKGTPENGASGDSSRATPQLGQAFLKIKIDNAVAQVKQLLAQGGN